MSTSPDHSTAQTEWDRAEGARFRSTAATTGLVALITLRELARRRGALALATLLPLTFYLVRLETHWTAIRLLSIGLGWATATLALFTQVSSRSVDRRLAVSGAPPASLLLGRYLAVLGLGWTIGLLYTGLVLATIGDELTHPSAVPVMLLLTATVATPLGPWPPPWFHGTWRGLFCCCRSWRCRYWWILPRAGPASYRCGRPENWRASSWRTWGRIPAPTCTAGWRMAQPWPPC